MRDPYFKTCRCGQSIVICDTRKGKRIAVNQTPSGTDAYKFRGFNRLEQMYQYGVHQPHLLTCTKPYKPQERRKRYV